jgi:hypothetical protein
MSTHHINRELDDALREMAGGVGAFVEFVATSKHRRAIFTFKGRTRFNTLSSSPRHSGVMQHSVAEAKRTLRSLGAAL